MMGKVPVGSRPSEDGGGRQGCLERSLRLRFVIACLSLDKTYGRVMELDVFCDTIKVHLNLCCTNHPLVDMECNNKEKEEFDPFLCCNNNNNIIIIIRNRV